MPMLSNKVILWSAIKTQMHLPFNSQHKQLVQLQNLFHPKFTGGGQLQYGLLTLRDCFTAWWPPLPWHVIVGQKNESKSWTALCTSIQDTKKLSLHCGPISGLPTSIYGKCVIVWEKKFNWVLSYLEILIGALWDSDWCLGMWNSQRCHSAY